MEVPLIVLEAKDEPIHADVIDDPGAKISTQGPIFEYSASSSIIVEAPTVIALGALDGL